MHTRKPTRLHGMLLKNTFLDIAKEEKSASLHPDDLGLVRNVTLRWKYKLTDKWEDIPYINLGLPNPADAYVSECACKYQ